MRPICIDGVGYFLVLVRPHSTHVFCQLCPFLNPPFPFAGSRARSPVQLTLTPSSSLTGARCSTTMAEEDQHVQRKLWEHPDPQSTGMWKFVQEVNAKRGVELKVRLLTYMACPFHGRPRPTHMITDPDHAKQCIYVLDLLGPSQLLPHPGVILLGGRIRCCLFHPLRHLHQGCR